MTVGWLGALLTSEFWPDEDFLFFVFGLVFVVGFFTFLFLPAQLRWWVRVISLVALVAGSSAILGVFSGPATCAEIIEGRFREMDRDLVYGREVSDESIVEGIDDPRIVDALWETFEEVMPFYGGDESYSRPLVRAAERNCERRGL